MGFGKVLLGIGAVAGAVVFAPAAIGAIATAGAAAIATAGTAATAVGGVVTGATGAAATLVGGAATAAASTSVGTAAIGAMSAVGSAVGTAAGALGATTVATAAGTSAGAAAVGTIATTGAIGAGSAISGVNKLHTASNIKEEAEQIYNDARDSFDKAESATNKSLEKLGKTKVKCWNMLKDYVKLVEKISNIDFDDSLQLDESLRLDKNELENIKILSITVNDILKGGIGALTGGQLIGLAASTGFTSIATASTGTAIAGLHGAAATNASLAALGGGSIATGGGGMALGATVLNVLSIAPAVAIGGLFINKKGKNNLKNATDMLSESKKLKEEFDLAIKELNKLKKLSNKVNTSLNAYIKIMDKYYNWLFDKVASESDYNNYSDDEKMKFRISFKLAVIIKNLACAELMNSENQIQDKAISNLISENETILTIVEE